MAESSHDQPERESENSTDPGFASDLYQLAKPRLSLLVVITAALGVAAAWPFIGNPSRPLTTPEMLDRLLQMAGLAGGTALLAASANALNQYFERQPDQLMKRTANRATATGRIGGKVIFVYSVLTGFCGTALLYIAGNELASFLGILSLMLYILIYTPLKKKSTLNTLVGAIPGALPPLIGWCGTGADILHPVGLSLFFILFAWQIPHFLAIAWMYREEYERAGFQMLPVIDPEGHRTARAAVMWSLFLCAASLIPAVTGASGWVYLSVAISLGGFMTLRALGLARDRDRAAARRLFLASLIYLPLVLGALVANPSAGG
ncbi:MAG: heme o synthase [Planctomycetota bacterium]|nr:heme o synthase [Planctomycetota bacterium]